MNGKVGAKDDEANCRSELVNSIRDIPLEPAIVNELLTELTIELEW